MGRPNKPSYFAPRRCWRFRYLGETHYFGKDIPPTEKPQMDGRPRRAWEAMAAAIREVDGRASAGTDPTVFWLGQLYLEACERRRDAGKLSEGQYAGHCTHLGHFWEFVPPGAPHRLGDAKARELAADQADAFFDWARSRGWSGHYLANLGKSVRACLNWGSAPQRGRVPARLIPANPLEDYPFPRAPKSVRRHVEGDKVRRFLRWAWARARSRPPKHLMRRFDRLFVLMLRFQRLTGARPGEACGLRWGDIRDREGVPLEAWGRGPHWSGAVVLLPPERHKTGRAGKTEEARVIFVTPPVARLLRAIRGLEGRHETHVFTHRRGNHAVDRGQGDEVAGEPWPDGSASSAKVRHWREEAIAEGLPLEATGPGRLVAYVNRHGYASEAVAMGFSAGQVAQLLGNTEAVVQATYVQQVREAAEASALDVAEMRRKIAGMKSKRAGG